MIITFVLAQSDPIKRWTLYIETKVEHKILENLNILILFK